MLARFRDEPQKTDGGYEIAMELRDLLARIEGAAMTHAPRVCHGPPTSRPQSKRTVAPCGAHIRDCSAKFVGDSWSSSLRFITCKKCRALLRCDFRRGDCLDPTDGLRSMAPEGGVVITDPVWPNRPAHLWPEVDAAALFGSLCAEFERLKPRRLVVIIGCDSDPRFLAPVPTSLPFVRACWLRYALPSYNGTVLNSGVVAYVFGDDRGPHGATLLPGEVTASRAEFRSHNAHPCPRKDEHMAWLVRYFTDPGELVIDPFAGSGTTGVAALQLGRRFLGWERDPKFYDLAAARLAGAREQMEMQLPAPRPKQARLPLLERKAG
jgi:DNA methylase